MLNAKISKTENVKSRFLSGKRNLLALVLFFVVGVSVKGQTNVYHPFPDSGAVWNGRYIGPWFTYIESYSYIMSGDTLIGSNVFHKLEIPLVATQGTPVWGSPFHYAGYAGCIRQDMPNKKVFYVAPGDTAQELLYNFNLQVGDTVPGFTRFGCQQMPQVIYGIDSILIGSDYRKRWLMAVNSTYFGFIEGIGSYAGLLEGCQEYMAADGPGFRLDCFKQNGITLYSYTSSTTCKVITSINNYQEANNLISLFPNPATNELTIENGELKIESVEIYDVVGRKVNLPVVSGQSSVVPNQPSTNNYPLTINISRLSPGIYFVRVKTEMGSVVKKLIKH